MITTVQELWFVVCLFAGIFLIIDRKSKIKHRIELDKLEEKIREIECKYENEYQVELRKLQNKIVRIEEPYKDTY